MKFFLGVLVGCLVTFLITYRAMYRRDDMSLSRLKDKSFLVVGYDPSPENEIRWEEAVANCFESPCKYKYVTMGFRDEAAFRQAFEAAVLAARAGGK